MGGDGKAPLDVESSPHVLDGAVVFLGTRIPLLEVGRRRVAGESVEDIVASHPELGPEHVELAETMHRLYVPLASALADLPPVDGDG